MDRQKILLIALGSAVIIGICAFAFWPRAATRPNAAQTPESTASASISPTAQPVRSEIPTPTPTVGGAVVGGPGPSEDEGYVGPLEDLSQHYAAADAGALAYATVLPDERVEDRSARLAPYFDVSSSFLTTLPRIANPHQYAGVKATVTPTSRAVAAFEGEDASTYSIMVVFSYRALYVQSEQTKEVFGTGTWHVTMSKAFDGKLISVTEPTDLD